MVDIRPKSKQWTKEQWHLCLSLGYDAAFARQEPELIPFRLQSPALYQPVTYSRNSFPSGQRSTNKWPIRLKSIIIYMGT
jgi:hypothetical protein